MALKSSSNLALKCTNSSFLSKEILTLQRSLSFYCKPFTVRETSFPGIKTVKSMRYFSRGPKSWMRTRKRNFDIVKISEVTPKKSVPDFVSKPVYAISGLDHSLSSGIEIHNSRSIQHMRQSCALARIVLDKVLSYVDVGVTTDDLDVIAHETCISYGAYPSPLNYRGFPKSICTSVNNIACHGVPDKRKLKDGDIISVDISVFYEGFHGDCAATVFAGSPDAKGEELLKIASQSLYKAISICKHGQDFCTIGNTISEFVEEHGFSVIPAFCGHGIGKAFHSSPSIYHHENQEVGKMEKGMIFTIEPVICEGSPDIVVLEDGWTATTEDMSRSAQFEHTLLVTEEGAEILTVPGTFETPRD